MSGYSLQNTLSKSFAVIGRVTGYNFSLYRPDSYANPVDERNNLKQVIAAATPDDAFGRFDIGELEKFKLYVKAESVQIGDILVSDELNKTYVIIDKIELRPPVAVLCQDRFNLLRPVISSGDRKTTFETIGTDIPAALKFTSITSSTGALQGMTSTMSASSSDLELWTWVTPDFIKLNDVIEIGVNRYIVTFNQCTRKGTNLKLRSTKVGK